MDSVIQDRVNEWLTEDYDEQTRSQIQALVDSDDQKELTERFYKNLDFGTGGLRGIIGAGTNRINIYTIAKVTQGLAQYILKQDPSAPGKGAVIAYDSRHMSPEFALETALVLAGNGIKVYLFESLRPTPLLSFAVRHLNAVAGVVITASHNPKEYNGYKVYWEDGAQIVPPHDRNIINEVLRTTSMKQVSKLSKETAQKKGLLTFIGKEIDNAYHEKAVKLSVNPKIIKQYCTDLKIVFTSLHGTGITLLPDLLTKIGFSDIHLVEKQKDPDPDFSTVVSPNPEESAALKLALADAKKIDADLILATDPDADRLGIAVKDPSGKHVLFSGNQTGSIMVYYMLSQLEKKGALPENGVIIKTIVTTELQRSIADKYGIECIDVLTGFKYIAEKIREFELQGTQKKPLKRFIVGGEESYGYLIGTNVRDKDAVIAAAMIAEIAAYAKSKNSSIYEMMEEIYKEFGYYTELLKSITLKGKDGMDSIANIMKTLRENPPKTLENIPVSYISDYKQSINFEPLKKQVIGTIDLPESNVLTFHTQDGSRVTIRPSGTEPKIKIYIGSMKSCEGQNLQKIKKQVQKKVDKLLDAFMKEVDKILKSKK